MKHKKFNSCSSSKSSGNSDHYSRSTRKYWYPLVELSIVVVEVVVNSSSSSISNSVIWRTKKKMILWWRAVQIHPATLPYTKTNKVLWNSSSNPLWNCGLTVRLTKVQKWKKVMKWYIDSWSAILQITLHISLDKSIVISIKHGRVSFPGLVLLNTFCYFAI